MLVTPVMLPPGRARLATMPRRTGSSPVAITTGMVLVAFFAASAATVPLVTSTSTLRAISSRNSAGSGSVLPAARRISKVTFLPST
jgi:hypothetical protein